MAKVEFGQSKLRSKAGFTHAKQGKGDSEGSGGRPNPVMNHGGTSFVFRAPKATGADRFCGTKGEGLLRHSGDSNAHQIGRKK